MSDITNEIRPRSAIAEIFAQLGISVLALVVITVLGCGVYPVVVWGISQLAFPQQANGSLVSRDDGTVIGSTLIGQNFTAAKYFQGRPSAAGSGNDPTASGGTNLGPTSDKLINGVHDPKNPSNNFDGIADLAKAYRTENGLATDAVVPGDAVTRSASGVDPHISLANALLQAPRVAAARKISLDAVQKAIDENTDGRSWGIFGEAGVNVLKLNMALDKASK